MCVRVYIYIYAFVCLRIGMYVLFTNSFVMSTRECSSFLSRNKISNGQFCREDRALSRMRFERVSGRITREAFIDRNRVTIRAPRISEVSSYETYACHARTIMPMG